MEPHSKFFKTILLFIHGQCVCFYFHVRLSYKNKISKNVCGGGEGGAGFETLLIKIVNDITRR